ncbi:hypothetical protein EII34_15120 [Arachnia propionica]|uniref:Uncharacterized protein n=1 Tax=Arachnia propionica TaxID=1750 RepID=A0A3P1T1K0_9ACTN|nr:hypothetical protein [Arachnia propionica]RRD03234.1 hypothetical protein EII34_15120 [Arachnia propionica]
MAEWWSIDLLDKEENLLGTFGQIEGGSVDWNIDRAIHGGGTLEVSQPPSGVDWLSHRLRLTHHRGEHTTRMGVWVPTWPEIDIDGDHRRMSVQVLDKTSILSREIPYMSEVTAGTVVTDKVAEIIRDRGEHAIAITPSPLTLPSTLTWDAKTTRLKQINDLLSAIGHGGLWCDGNGWFRAEPYVAPGDRPLAATYGGDPGDYRVLRTYRDAANLADLPNRVVVYSPGSSTRAAMRADAELPASHPLGSHRRGDIPRTYDGVEAANQQVLDRHAERLLAQATNVTRRVTYRHPVDDVQLRDRVHIRRLNIDGAVINRRIQLGIGPVVEDTIRHIYAAGDKLWI